MWHNSENADLLYTRHASYNKELDLAVVMLEAQEDKHKEFNPSSMLLNANPPSIGEVVHMISLDKQEITNYSPPTDKSGKGAAVVMHRRVSIRVGTVTEVYPSGYRQYNWPCFTTSIPATEGMSGGMVIRHVQKDNTPSVCGIVCADNSEPKSKIDFTLPGESVIACSWPALSLTVPAVIAKNPPMMTIYEMMKNNSIHPAIGLENILSNVDENGKGSIGIKK